MLLTDVPAKIIMKKKGKCNGRKNCVDRHCFYLQNPSAQTRKTFIDIPQNKFIKKSK